MKKKEIVFIFFSMWILGCEERQKSIEIIESFSSEGPTNTDCVSDECACQDSEILCRETCSNVLVDPLNCGSCGHTCKDSQTCVQGECVRECEGDLILCSGKCVSLFTNERHCGKCDSACMADKFCLQGRCVCHQDKIFCDGKCIDNMTDNSHCGVCNNSCGKGLFCENGTCVCEEGKELCSGQCVDLLTDSNHCSSCNMRCMRKEICHEGTCICAEGTTMCGNECVDTRSSTDHCGVCGNICTGGKNCVDGECKCDEGFEECSGKCRDLEIDTENCGECEHTCYRGETCDQGSCHGIVGSDLCLDEPVREMTISEVAAYQTVKIVLAMGQQEIDGESRSARIVKERESLFRVFVTLEQGWSPREVSARLTLNNDGQIDQYHAKMIPSSKSSDEVQDSTFQIFVPGDKIREETTYSVEIVECAGGAVGTLYSARFPVEGSAGLMATTTGPLKVVIVPIEVNGHLPDTSEEGLAIYRDYLGAIYPVTEVQLRVGLKIETTNPVNWDNMLDQVRNARLTRAAASDEYYFGMVMPEAQLEDYCGYSGCTLGLGYVASQDISALRVAVGIAYGDELSATTMAHELGHNHGRTHSPCGVEEIESIDENYPYAGGVIGTWGYDWMNGRFISPSAKDVMSYCGNIWISDYTYRGLTERVIDVNDTAKKKYHDTQKLSRWRVLILDNIGPRWGIPITKPSASFGVSQEIIILDESDRILKRETGYKTEIGGVLPSSIVLIPEPGEHWHSVQLERHPAIKFSDPISVPH